MLLFGCLLYSLLVNHNNNRFKKVYYLASTVLGIYGVVVFMLLGANITLILM